MVKHGERVHYDEAQKEGTLRRSTERGYTMMKHGERVHYDEAQREDTL